MSEVVHEAIDGARVIVDTEKGDILRLATWQERADALREKRVKDGKPIVDTLMRPGGKRMRGDDYSADAIGYDIFFDGTEDIPDKEREHPSSFCPLGACETCDKVFAKLGSLDCTEYEMPKVVIENEAERVEAFKRKMGWVARGSIVPRRAAFTKAREKDGIEIICGIIFHYLNHEIAYGRNAKGEDVSYNFRTGKLLFTPSVNRAKKIMAALNARGVARVHAQTGIPKDVLKKWKQQGNCGGV
jgi:hypothetical protein